MAKNGEDRKTILLVDDDPLILHLREQILAKLGYSVQTAASLEEAQSAWRPGVYALIVVDLRQNVAKALEFCEAIKRVAPEQLLVFLTQTNTYVPSNACPDEVVPKDGGPAQFVERVQSLLGAG